MFIGHFAPAFIAAAHVRNTSKTNAPGLGTFFVAAQLVDFGFFAFTLLGIEKMRITPGISAMNSMDLYHMPYTHSLLGTLLWGAVFAVLVYLATRHKTASIWAGLIVLSHWFIDLLVHIPDLTLAGGGDKIGLGLWDCPRIAIPLELALIGGAIFYYIKLTGQKRGTGRWRLRLLITALLAVQLFNWFAEPPVQFGADMAVTALAAFAVLALLAAWTGKSRVHRNRGIM
ncbi:hypothetical protein [Sphingorhabdus sp. Alg239-R122]|uniref:hypothetical protein n=1 Tax=Sphingorhabdus sp. Alg239-R122 TaxID=2305989 RepID=UPI0013D8F9BA|nr:hypothetical protein [Sphingorhabdus sp. Alg239-R122]